MIYPLDLKVNPVSMSPLPLDLDQLKTHARVDGANLDENIEIYLESAIDWAEGFMQRTIFQRGHRWVLKDFPRYRRQEIRLPRGKTQSVESIVYKTGGTTYTIYGPSSTVSPATASWQEDLSGDQGAVLTPLRGESWPNVDDYDAPDPVVINFTAGWADASVPKSIIHALWLTVADAVDMVNTGDFAEGPRIKARMNLLNQWAIHRVYGRE